MKIINLYTELKKNNLFTNSLLILILLYPISIVGGPALIEITIFFSILTSIYIFKFIEYKEYFYKYDLKYLIIFFLVCLISSLFSDNILSSLKSSFFSLRFFLFSIVIVLVLKNIKKSKELFLICGFIFLVICIFDGYIQLLFGKNIFFYNTNSDIVTGFFLDEKKLGRYLITISPILIGIYLSSEELNLNKKSLISLILLNFIFLIVLFTSERVSMFYSSFTILVTVLFACRISKKYLLFLFIPFLIFFSSYILNVNNFKHTVIDSINQITDNKKLFSYPSKEHRNFMITSFELFKKNPIVGIGPNNYRHSCDEINLQERNCSTHPHNILFQILSETGLIGFLIYLFFLMFILKKILNFIFSKKNLDFKIFFLLPVFYYINPFLPSGNFFNNWFMAVGTLGVPFYLHFNEIKINKN